MLRITNLKLALDKAIDRESEITNLKKMVISQYRLRKDYLRNLIICRKSTDARKKENVHFVYNVDIDYVDESFLLKKNIKNMSITPENKYIEPEIGTMRLNHRPVVIGFGPSGIFAAYLLAKMGYKPIVLERGLDVEQRTKAWYDFLKTREFKENASILFGEGGAGTFSDGKLTTLINDKRCDYILKTFVNAGADEEILYINKPHIGTDVLKKVISNIRKEIISLGGEIRFNAKVTNFVVENDLLKQVIINEKEVLDTEICLMGIGHSARDTFKLLYEKKLNLAQKPFSIGLRIEHPQTLINEAQYGEFASHKALGAADYKLSYHSPSGRTAYTFCMCPGGYVVCSSSESGTVLTNGMSLSKRDNKNANSAILVNINPTDFNSDHPLAGIIYQKQYEELAFKLAGSNFNAPIQLVKDFLENKNSTSLGEVIPSFEPGTTFINLNEILPGYVTKTLSEAILYFDNKIKGFAKPDAILTGVETRSSSPIRIIRNEFHETNIIGLYSMGEGAGYSGGIMSSAVDGMKTAEIIINKFRMPILKY